MRGSCAARRRFEATIDNAQALIELDGEHGSFDRYLRSHGGFEPTVADLKRQFRFIGDTGAYHFLWSVDQPTPPHEEWFSDKRRKPSRRRQATGGRRRRHSGTATSG